MAMLKAPTNQWDVIIIGAGPAGSAAAMTLSRLGRKVLIIEKSLSPSVKLGESLPPQAIDLVTHYLGSIDALITEGIGTKTHGNISAWGSAEPETSNFFFSPTGFGLCINRAAFEEALCKRAVSAGAELCRGTQFQGCARIEHPSAGWHVQATCNSKTHHYTCRYLLDCSGRQAVVAKALGIQQQFSDQLFAFAQYYQSPQQDDDCHTYIEATADGWFYSNRLSNDHLKHPASHTQTASTRIVVFHTDKHDPSAKIASTAEGFQSLLEKTDSLASLINEGHYHPHGNIKGASAASAHLEAFAGDGWLALGDAAQAYDPLSSQGIYKALLSANKAGQLLHYALSESTTEASSPYLQRYINSQEQLWAEYQKHFFHFYQQQPRWSDHPFWRQRKTPNHIASLHSQRMPHETYL